MKPKSMVLRELRVTSYEAGSCTIYNRLWYLWWFTTAVHTNRIFLEDNNNINFNPPKRSNNVQHPINDRQPSAALTTCF